MATALPRHVQHAKTFIQRPRSFATIVTVSETTAQTAGMAQIHRDLRALAHDDFAHARFAALTLTEAERADAIQTQAALAAERRLDESAGPELIDATPVFALQAWRLEMRRARWRCEACGLTAPEEMEIGHRDGDHHNQRRSNLRCLCAFCHLVDHPVAALRRGRATLLYAPDLEQADVSRIAWSLAWLIRELGQMYQESSGPPGCDIGATRSTLETTLMARRKRAMRELGLDGRDPAAAAALYFELARQAIVMESIATTDVAPLLQKVRIAPTFMLPQVAPLDGRETPRRDRLPAMLAAACMPGGSFFEVNPARMLGDARKARDAQAASMPASTVGADLAASVSTFPQLSPDETASATGAVLPPHLDEFVDEDS